MSGSQLFNNFLKVIFINKTSGNHVFEEYEISPPTEKSFLFLSGRHGFTLDKVKVGLSANSTLWMNLKI